MRKRLAQAVRDPALVARTMMQWGDTTLSRARRAPVSVVHWRTEQRERRAGLEAWRRDDVDGAHAHFATATETGTHPSTWLWFARTSLRCGELTTSAQAVAEALDISPASPYVRNDAANVLRGMRRVAEGIALLEGIAQRGRSHDIATARRMLIAFGAPDRADALTTWSRPSPRHNGRTSRRARAALAAWRPALERGAPAVACDAMVRALVASPDAVSVRLELGTLLHRLERGAEAVGLLEEFARGQRGGEMVALARAMVDAGGVDDARTTADWLRAEGCTELAAVFDAVLANAQDDREGAAAIALRIAPSPRYTAIARARLLLDVWQLDTGWSELRSITPWASAQLLVRYTEVFYYLGKLSLAHEAGALACARHPEGREGEQAARLEDLSAAGVRALEQGVTLTPGTTDLTYEGTRGRSFYLLHNSLPYMSGGYASRSHGLLRALVQRGRRVDGITRPGYPYVIFDEAIPAVPDVDEIDGVVYRRTGGPRRYDDRHVNRYCDEFVDVLEPLAKRERIEVLHAASFYWNGLVANEVKRRLGIPSVYEVRGLGEITRRSREPAYADTEAYALSVRLEAQAANEADAVITITGALRDEMVGRGVDSSKITIVPNGVDTKRFVPRPRDEELEERLGLQGKFVFGFVGTLEDYEGLDLLLQSVARLRASRDDVRVLIVGRGSARPRLDAATERLGLGDIVTFTGRVPHEEVERYLSVIDVTPFPRRAYLVCEMVSPLKPLESMATGKLVVASSVAALAEMVDDGRTGLVFEKESVDDLTRVLTRALDDDLRRSCTAAARAWVEEERGWDVLSGRVESLYESLLSTTRVSAP